MGGIGTDGVAPPPVDAHAEGPDGPGRAWRPGAPSMSEDTDRLKEYPRNGLLGLVGRAARTSPVDRRTIALKRARGYGASAPDRPTTTSSAPGSSPTRRIDQVVLERLEPNPWWFLRFSRQDHGDRRAVLEFWNEIECVAHTITTRSRSHGSTTHPSRRQISSLIFEPRGPLRSRTRHRRIRPLKHGPCPRLDQAIACEARSPTDVWAGRPRREGRRLSIERMIPISGSHAEKAAKEAMASPSGKP